LDLPLVLPGRLFLYLTVNKEFNMAENLFNSIVHAIFGTPVERSSSGMASAHTPTRQIKDFTNEELIAAADRQTKKLTDVTKSDNGMTPTRREYTYSTSMDSLSAVRNELGKRMNEHSRKVRGE
jgi:hypothetical protein